MKKLIALLLTAVIATSVMLTFAGCDGGDYPVKVANVVINKKPENVVVLDPSAADIISYIGYDVVMAGRSDEVDQEWLSIVPSVGSAADPDIASIVAVKADTVFATEALSDTAKQSLRDNKITVITMSTAQTTEQLETNYLTLGKVLGGNKTGFNKADAAFNELFAEMDSIKAAAEEAQPNILNTVCYLYSENGQLMMMTNGTYTDMLLGYTGAMNTAVNIFESDVDANTLRLANPSYILYDSEETLNIIKTNDTLKNLTAVKNNKTMCIPFDRLYRQGKTTIDTLTSIVEFMYPQLSTTQTSAQPQGGEPATQATTEPEQTLAKQYKIKLDDKLSLKLEDENKNVKAMQQRLYDLGYVTDKGNITGYYGEVSKAAVTEFQKQNSIPETGTADNATLKAMFDENAVKAK